eukprot:541298-Lingulodinium_polyedra.AAC.1
MGQQDLLGDAQGHPIYVGENRVRRREQGVSAVQRPRPPGVAPRLSSHGSAGVPRPGVVEHAEVARVRQPLAGQ